MALSESPYLHKISEIARKADVSPIEFADRQSILLLNPGLNGRLQVTNTIRCAIRSTTRAMSHPCTCIPECKPDHPVQQGRLHRGRRRTLHRRSGRSDLTPNGTWHDHGNDSNEPVIWIDTLDWPLMEFLDAAWVDHDMPGAQGNTNVQPVTFSEGYSRKLYGQGGLKPAFVDHQRGSATPGAAVPLPRRRRAGDAARPAQREGRPVRGHQDRVRQSGNRRTGLQDTRLFGAAPAIGRGDRVSRETAGTYYVVIEGSGATEVGGKRFEWGHNDLFVVPNFLWRRHINTGKTDAVIYSVSDALLRNIGQYYAQGRAKDGRSPSWCNEGRAPRRKLRAQASSATVLRRVPISGTATSTTSPVLSHTDGLRARPRRSAFPSRSGRRA